MSAFRQEEATVTETTLADRWPVALIKALHDEADREWGYDWEKVNGIARALDAIERVCPAAGAALHAYVESPDARD